MATGVDTAKDYPIPLRRIRYYDTETDERLVFITNSFDLPALAIATSSIRLDGRWHSNLNAHIATLLPSDRITP